MMLDNRKRIKEPEIESNKFNYPEVNKNTIPQEIYNVVYERNKRSIPFKVETKLFPSKLEALYDISDFEIYLSTNRKSNNKQSSPDRYIHIDKINSEKMNYYIQGVITGPPGSKYLNQLVYAEISEYSLQYGDKSEWSLWIQVTNDPWLKLNQPFSAYSKFFSPMFYRFKVVMNTTDFFEKKVKKNVKKKYSLDNLEKYIQRNYDDYQKGDILGFKDEVLKHVCQFLNININTHDVISTINREMELKIMERKNYKPSLRNIEIIKFLPPQTHVNVFIDRIQTEIGKELKKLRYEMSDCFKKRELERKKETISVTDDDRDNSEEIDEDDQDDEDDEDEDDSEFGNYYRFNEDDLDGINDLKYGYNYDFDFNYDDEPYQKEAILPDKRERDSANVVNSLDIQSHDYLLKEDKLYFDRLPLETIVYKSYGSLFTLPCLDVELENPNNFGFNPDNESFDNILPFLICRVCGYAKHIVSAYCDSSPQDINQEISESIVDYIIHLEKHRIEILKSISKKSRDRLDKSLIFNNTLNRSKVEKIELNALKQNLRKKKSILLLKNRLKSLSIKNNIQNNYSNNNDSNNNRNNNNIINNINNINNNINNNDNNNNKVFNPWP
ncbi:hypothetical protein ACTFIU_001280 [Dictyostelium citrinum]